MLHSAVYSVRHMDWTKIIADLIAAGWSQTSIAQALGISQPSVSAIANGFTRKPSYDIGSKLLELHRNRQAAGAAP